MEFPESIPRPGKAHLRMPRRRWLAAALVVLTLATAGGTAAKLFVTARAINPRVTVGEVVSAVANQADVPGSLAYSLHNGERVNILLLGYGGAGHDGGYLTDSIMVLSIQGPGRVALTSIPRDTYVSIPGLASGTTYDGKLNAAFALPLANGVFGKISDTYNTGFDGAGRLASKVVGDYLGIPITYFVAVDFTAFKTVVDAVGGIDIVNPSVLDDYQYPAGETGGYMHIHFDAGPLHLTGDQALIYVRERHADSDFGRSKRQQQVIAAVKDKAVSIGAIPHLLTLLDAVSNNVHSNLTPNDMRVLASQANQLSSSSTHHVSIDNTNWQYETTTWAAGYILLLRDQTGATLKRFIAAEMVDPSVTAEAATIQIVAGSGRGAQQQPSAATWTSVLSMLNFNMGAPGTEAVSPPQAQVHDYSGGAGTLTAAWLAAYYGGVVVTEKPVTTGPQIVVELGTTLPG